VTWTIRITETAVNQSRKLRADANRQIHDYLRDRVAPLQDPRQLGKPLRFSAQPSLWRYRVGTYRILCEIRDDELLVLVIKVGHRRSVYRRL